MFSGWNEPTEMVSGLENQLPPVLFEAYLSPSAFNTIPQDTQSVVVEKKNKEWAEFLKEVTVGFLNGQISLLFII